MPEPALTTEAAVGWKERILAFGRKYGKPAGFVAKLALETLVPGAPLLVELAERVLECGEDAAESARQEELLRQVQATGADVGRLAQALALLETEMGTVLAQVAALQDQPERARKLLVLARSTDANVRAAAAKLDVLVSRFDHVAAQNDRILQGQEELRALIEGVVAGRSSAEAPSMLPATARVGTLPPAALPLIDSREVARREQRLWAQRLNCELSWTNDLGIRFRLVPPGRFRMGAADGDVHAASDERPPQTITVAQPLFVATFLLTAGVIRSFAQEASAPDDPDVARLLRDRAFAYHCRRAECGDDVPAVEISARDALVLCAWMGRCDGRSYRLPTEAEWEYFARAGAGGLYWWEAGLAAEGRAIFAATGAVALDDRRANVWGLCDVLGNVAEWTASEYAPLDSGLPTRPARRAASTLTVRGGSWRDALQQVRLSRRLSMNPAARKDWLGVRLVCEGPSAG
jgi:formylglycine-generating enzyme required for sulfatase activity